jgi:putative nucleotidyltransferase with HDIG domain
MINANDSTQKYKILVVEDDDDFRQALRILLTANRFDITDCGNGKEAKAVLELNSFDLILSDIRMPFMHGIELLQHVRKTSTVPFVLMTGFSEIIETTEAYKVGATDFITKPFQPEEMLATINGCLLMRAEQLTVTENEPSVDHYCAIHIDDFLGNNELSVDIYVRLTEQKHVKIGHKGSVVESKQVLAYKAKNMEYLYIKQSDFGVYVNMNLKIAEDVTDLSEATVELKSNILKLTQDRIVQDIFLAGFDRAKFDSAASVTQLTVATVCNSQEVLRLIDALNIQTDYLYTHSVGVSTYSVMIAHRMGWHSSLVLFKLALGGLFHDIGKKEIEREILDKAHWDLTPKEIAKLESHGFRGKAILESFGHIPSDVVTIASQHHENINGFGPLGLKEIDIHPLAKVVSVANRFCELTMKNPSQPQTLTPVAAVERMLSSSGDYDKTALEALMHLLPGLQQAEIA